MDCQKMEEMGKNIPVNKFTMFLLMLISFVLVSCGTHAPMSEMVMFNKEKSDEGKDRSSGHGVGLANIPFAESDFREVTPGDYLKSTYPAAYSYHIFFMIEDRVGFSASAGSGLGGDLTYQVYESYYLTLAYSAPQSLKLIAQKSLINTPMTGVATGLYAGNYSSLYNNYCKESPCGYDFGPDGAGMIFVAGVRSRFLFHEKRKPGLGVTGFIEPGYAFEINEPYIGFGISISAF